MERTFCRIKTVLTAATLFLFAFSVYAEKRIVAYVPNWVDLNAFAGTIDYAKLTHINIAFENPRNLEGDLSFNAKNEVLIAKAHTNGVRILVSIGGGSASTDKTLRARYDQLLNQTNRAGFVSKLSAYLTSHGFDGLDVDIEGPAINPDYGAFVRDLSETLKSQGKLLTAALSKHYGGDKVPESVFKYLDFVNVMAYDGTGTWSPQSPGQHSSFEFATNNIAYWMGRGLAREKAVLGVPFYGYGFGTAYRKRDYSYKGILAEYPGAEKLDQVGDTIWYNGIPTIKAKSRYVVEQGLGGVMIWSLDYDVSGENSLLSAIHEVLHEKQVPATPSRKP